MNINQCLSCQQTVSTRRWRSLAPHSGAEAQSQPRAAGEIIGSIAEASPFFVQDFLVGGAVIGTIGAALVAGLQKDPVVCDLCQGNGGTRCFVCEGDGKAATKKKMSRDELGAIEAPAKKRDIMGGSVNPRDCQVCRGAGLIGCRKCRGSGYV